MKKFLFILLWIGVLHSAAWAQETAPLAVRFTVQQTTQSDVTSTINLNVDVTNNGAETLTEIAIAPVWPPGGEIGGSIVLDRLEANQTVQVDGQFTAPLGFFETVQPEALGWIATYHDGSGQIRTAAVHVEQ